MFDAELTSNVKEIFISGLIITISLVFHRRVIFRKADRRINKSLLIVVILFGVISVFLKFYFIAFAMWLTLAGIHTELFNKASKDRIPERINWLIEKTRLFIWEICNNIAHFKGCPRAVVYGFLCTVFGFVLSVSSIYLLSQGYTWNFDISWLAIMKSLGITNFASIIPLPGNSLGVSEAIFDNSLETLELQTLIRWEPGSCCTFPTAYR